MSKRAGHQGTRDEEDEEDAKMMMMKTRAMSFLCTEYQFLLFYT